ncbi:non-homologous end-joining DNA ligase [Amycolatopsis vancoresmycina]|uniref:ATP-dependent DNA ligase/DNA primase n=1 Tax=Amycolatopsis vancoresmycina DSM 44592 TaxID=1292037 RepID=R1FZY2_9PSEU|nr:non-homologous end-joining DNA ligase [Amycolatopsis vancoresmycina]EOD64883.1 ATP-dependent DNA ligase/DNA primase [Amycolatopsis vancoresmycina DSM 44592]
MSSDEVRHGVKLSSLDQEVFPESGVTKREMLDYLEAVAERMLPELHDRLLTVLRVLRGQGPFMQKNLPKYTPDWVERASMWAETSKRDVSYALCNDLRTLLWFGNQRAIEYHTSLFRRDVANGPTHLILDLDPPADAPFSLAVGAAKLVREALRNDGLDGAVKTSGSKGVHVFVPLAPGQSMEDIAAATRAVAVRAERIDPALGTTEFVVERREGKVFLDSTRAGGATVISVYSPRHRPGAPVSFPVRWTDVDGVKPGDFTVHTVPDLLDSGDPWTAEMPEPFVLPADLVEEGHTIPIARVAAMHEGKRRARAARESG